MNSPSPPGNRARPEWGPLAAVCSAAIIVNADVALKPLLLASYMEFWNYGAQHAAYLIAIEASATAGATALTAAFVARVDRRRTMLLALLVIALANGLSLAVSSFVTLAGARALAGLGHGAGLAIVAASIATFRQPDRAAGAMTMAASVAGTIMMFVIPLAQAAFGAKPIFWVMAALALPPLLFLRALPVRGDDARNVSAPQASLLRPIVLLSLLVAAFFYLSVGAFGPFSAQLGRDAGLTYQQSGQVLGFAGVASLLGAVIAVVVGDRFGRAAPVLLSVLGASSALVALLIFPQSPLAYLFSVPAFFFCWASVYPYLMGFASLLDPSGRVNGLFFTLSLIGFAAGPAIGGLLTSLSADTRQGLSYVVIFSLVCLIPALGFAPIVKTQR